MADQKKAPFRANHVGSLLRPPELREARDKHAKGEISAAQLREIEDRCIRDVVKMQEDIGMPGITDGEFRRTLWNADFLRQIEGVKVEEGLVLERRYGRIEWLHVAGPTQADLVPDRFRLRP